jgi:hypothetical protein
MHHYRCQNVYISATASEGIIDTIKFFPHNFQMPQLSSTYILIMAANDMSNALKNPHPEVPFSYIGDDTITALTTRAKKLKNKIQKVQIPRLPTAPAKVAERTFPAESSNPVLASPMPPQRQTRSQKNHAQDITNAPLLPRVVTPMIRQPAPPRVPRRSQNMSPRNLSQDDFCGMDTAHMAIALGNRHWSQQHQANAVAHPITEKEMEYIALMKDPRLQPFWKRGFGNEVSPFFKAFMTFLEPTHVSLSNLQTSQNTDRSRKIVCDYKPHKKEKE